MADPADAAAAAAAIAVGAAQVNDTDNPFAMLPDAPLKNILDRLDFKDTRKFHMTTNDHYNNRRPTYEASLSALVLPGCPPVEFLDNLSHVESLDFGPHCSDDILEHMTNERVCPRLKHLAMARSMNVTDQGLLSLLENPNRRALLKTLDITFCCHPTFGATLRLRAGLRALQVIRRQPPWMDGTWASRRTHYSDGSYIYRSDNGELIEYGYVINLFESGDGRIICKRQKFVPVQHERTWVGYVNLRLGEVWQNFPNLGGALYVVHVNGLFPPQGFWLVGRGSGSFNRQGIRLNFDPRTDLDVYAHVVFLPHGQSTMPPQELVEMCRAGVDSMNRVMAGRDQEEDERDLNVQSGGNENDYVPPGYFGN